MEKKSDFKERVLNETVRRGVVNKLALNRIVWFDRRSFPSKSQVDLRGFKIYTAWHFYQIPLGYELTKHT